jgi:hypothetical protein
MMLRVSLFALVGAVAPLVNAVARGAVATEADYMLLPQPVNGGPCVLGPGGKSCLPLPKGSPEFSASKTTTPGECVDLAGDCYERSKNYGCILDFAEMEADCPRTCLSCGNLLGDGRHHSVYSAVAQAIPADEKTRQKVLDLLEASDRYMHDEVYQHVDLGKELLFCQNRHRSCTFWAAVSECERNPTYMELNCSPACHSCSRVIFEQRCPVTEELKKTNAWGPGDLNQAFQEIVDNPEWQAYNLKIHSQPNPSDPAIFDGPWVITLDDFVTKDECTRMIELGRVEGYERSEDHSDAMHVDGSFEGILSEERTSTNAWCTDDCFEDKATNDILGRIERLIRIPESNYEFLQLLRYDVGQFYGVHHDFIDSQVNRPPGPRVGPSFGVTVGANIWNTLFANPYLFRS